MEKFLKQSYGVLVYQDDLLYTAIELAGYNWKEVDVFRKAVGKKIPELMAKEEKTFKQRVRERMDMPPAKVDALWNLFDPFKGYGFNKSHAMCYATVAYQTAYMKANFPSQYMAAHLNAIAGDTEHVSELIYEAKRINLNVLPPSINKSGASFTTENNQGKYEDIRIGMATIKQVGAAVAQSIITEKEKQGVYTSLEDFFIRIAPYKTINRRGLEALSKVGMFDEFEKRNTLLENIELLLRCMKDMSTDTGQHELFDTKPNIALDLKPSEKQVSKVQELYWEKELLGAYVSGHPLQEFKREGLQVKEVKGKEKNSKVCITVVIEQLKPFRNKKGEKMYFVTLEDDTNEKVEAVCFPQEAEKYEELLAPHRPVIIWGTTTMRNEEVSIRIDKVEIPSSAEKENI